MAEIRRNLIDSLTTYLPNLLESPKLPLKLQDSDVWEYVKKTTKTGERAPSLLMVVFESDNSYVGKEVALTLSKYSEVRVIMFRKKNSIYDRLGLEGWPAAGYLKNDKTSGSILLGKNENLSDVLIKSVISLANLPQNL